MDFVRKGLEKSGWTEFCEVLMDEGAAVEGLEIAEPCIPDLCMIDNLNSVAFITENSNPFNCILNQCYEHKFQKYMPLCLALNDCRF